MVALTSDYSAPDYPASYLSRSGVEYDSGVACVRTVTSQPSRTDHLKCVV